MFRPFSSKVRTVPMSPEYEIFLRDLFTGVQDYEETSLNGVLAFVGHNVVGWCAIDCAASGVHHDYVARGLAQDSGQWIIHCLYVHPGHSQQGVSARLIEGAIQLARNQGAREVLAFPLLESSRGMKSSVSSDLSGRTSVYLDLGFKLAERLDDRYQVMRLSLDGSARSGPENISWSNL